MKTRAFLVVLTLALAATFASAGVEFDLQYAFEVGAKSDILVSAKIDSVEMGEGVPMAVTGDAKMDVALEVVEVCDQGIAVIVATFGEVEATLMGDRQRATTPAPVTLHVDSKGRILDAAAADGPELDLFAGGGLPLQVVVLLAGIVELPDEPIAMTDTWTLERSQQMPDVGEVATNLTSRLTSIDAQETVVTSDVSASFPNFTSANPLQDNDITVTNGVLTVEGLERTIDASSALIREANGSMRFNGFAQIGDFMRLPLNLTSSFTIEAR